MPTTYLKRSKPLISTAMSLLAKHSLDDPITLTPFQRQRKKRPSCSPIKSPRIETPAPRFYSNPSTSQKLTANQDAHTIIETLNTGMESLQFEEFSSDDGKGGYKGCTVAMFGKMRIRSRKRKLRSRSPTGIHPYRTPTLNHPSLIFSLMQQCLGTRCGDRYTEG